MKDSLGHGFSPATFQAAFNWDDWGNLPYDLHTNCWGLVRTVIWHGLGVFLPSFEEYGETFFQEDAHRRIVEREALSQLSDWHPVTDGQPFDVVVFRGEPNHVGVVVQPGLFLHVERGDHSRVESYMSRRWKHRLDAIYRYQA